jgi:hypothetical protein
MIMNSFVNSFYVWKKLDYVKFIIHKFLNKNESSLKMIKFDIYNIIVLFAWDKNVYKGQRQYLLFIFLTRIKVLLYLGTILLVFLKNIK